MHWLKEQSVQLGNLPWEVMSAVENTVAHEVPPEGTTAHLQPPEDTCLRWDTFLTRDSLTGVGIGHGTFAAVIAAVGTGGQCRQQGDHC